MVEISLFNLVVICYIMLGLGFYMALDVTKFIEQVFLIGEVDGIEVFITYTILLAICILIWPFLLILIFVGTKVGEDYERKN